MEHPVGLPGYSSASYSMPNPCLPSLYLSLEQRTLWAILTVKSYLLLLTPPFWSSSRSGSCCSIRSVSRVKADPKPSYSTTQAEISGEAVSIGESTTTSPQPSLNFPCCHLLAPEAWVLPGQRGPGAHVHSCCRSDAETQVLPGVLGAIAHKTDCKALGWDSLSCDLALT